MNFLYSNFIINLFVVKCLVCFRGINFNHKQNLRVCCLFLASKFGYTYCWSNRQSFQNISYNRISTAKLNLLKFFMRSYTELMCKAGEKLVFDGTELQQRCCRNMNTCKMKVVKANVHQSV